MERRKPRRVRTNSNCIMGGRDATARNTPVCVCVCRNPTTDQGNVDDDVRDHLKLSRNTKVIDTENIPNNIRKL